MSEFVGIEDVAKHFNVSVSTARAWVRQKEIPKTHTLRLVRLTDSNWMQ